MIVETYSIQPGVVNDLRKIRDQISAEIKDTTFDKEIAYLGKLLSDKDGIVHNKSVPSKEA